MELYWEGTNITPHVTITGCVHRDASRGRSDSLELRLAHASTWYQWGPEEDDEIRIAEDGYTTGRMYLSAIFPEGDEYRILATSTRRAAGRKAWKTYRNITLQGIFESCGAESGMEGKLYGISGKLDYPYILRENEGAGAFLNRIGGMEGLAVKTYHGCYRGISIPWAQETEAVAGFAIRAERQEGVTYRRRNNIKITALTVRTPWAEAIARDTEAKGNNPRVITHLPALNAAQAGRWARGLLLQHNRMAEEITIDTALDFRLTAMARVDITGNTDMSGMWMVDEAEHDLIDRQTTVRLLRVTDSIR